MITLNVEEVITNKEFTPEEGAPSSSFLNDDEEGYNFNSDKTYTMSQINEPLIYYDWFGDSATSCHVTNRRDIFVTYEKLQNTSMIGVGKLRTKAEGRGTVELESQHNDKKYILKLQNVLYIPTNRNNLISLGKWDEAGGRYIGGNGQIILENKQGNIVAIGSKMDNNLYQLKLKPRIPTKILPNKSPNTLYSFQTTGETQDWDTWHRRYGHIGYSGLQKLFDLKMVNGLTVNKDSIKPDCKICIQSKQTVKPFDGISN